MSIERLTTDFWSFGLGFPPGGIMILLGPWAMGVMWDE